jgi:hypothetical protein
MNKGIYKNNTSGTPGVVWDKRTDKWVAHIRKENKRITLGYFDNIEDAIKLRKEAELKYFGEYRYKTE